ncbi:MAG: tetratricopeptide repeat protein [Cyanobacteriota bacterium]
MADEKTGLDNDFKIIIIILAVIVISILLIILSCGVSGYLMYKPAMSSFYYSQGVSYKAKGWIYKSKSALNKAIKIDPDGEMGKKAALFLKIRLPKSDNIKQEAIQKNIYGYNLDVQKNYKEAIVQFEEAIEISPDFEWPYSNMARTYTTLKEYDKAIPLFEKAIDLNPDYVNAYLNLGYLYWKRGYEYQKSAEYDLALIDYENALDKYSKGLSLNPDDSGIQEDVMEIKENICYIKNKSLKRN